MAQGNVDKAIDYYRRHVAFFPNLVNGYVGLGYALTEKANWLEAINVLEKALSINAESSSANFLLGRAYFNVDDLFSAEKYWKRANLLDPKNEAIYADYCFLLFKNGKIKDAISLIEVGIENFPDNSQFYFYYGNLLAETGDYASAVMHYRNSVNLGDQSPGLYASMGACLIQTSRHDDAIDALKKAKALDPSSAIAASNYLLAIQYSKNISMAEKFSVAQEFSKSFEAELEDEWGNYHQCADALVSRKLRVGYVSGDFRAHSLAFFFEPIIKNHDKSKFEIFSYYSYPTIDVVSERIRKESYKWIPCYGMTDSELASRIREDEIDVLIDLSGHTGNNRLLTFARKPAPVQMTWLGYQATTGLRAIDYRITDESLDPTGTTESFHSEKLIRLSASGTFSPSPDSPFVNELPVHSGNPFTFGCLNNPSKITDDAIEVWAQILNKSLGSRLMIGNATSELIDKFSEQFSKFNVDSDRLIFKPKVSLKDYLILHHQIDLALDTFPYNGGTTTFHSLWMGVPIIALDGNSALSNVGASIMRAVGLQRFCAMSQESYIDNALFFSKNTSDLAEVRRSLRVVLNDVNEKLAVSVTKEIEGAIESSLMEFCEKSYIYNR